MVHGVTEVTQHAYTLHNKGETFSTYSLFYPLLSEEKTAFRPLQTALNKLFCPSLTSSEIFITKVHAPAPYEQSLKPCSPRPSSITALMRGLYEYYLLVCGNLLKPCSFKVSTVRDVNYLGNDGRLN